MKGGNRLILFATFVLVLLAGIVLGRLWGRLPERRLAPDSSPSWLADQLNLTQEQRQKMDAIWAEARKELGDGMKARRDLEKQQADAIVALLTPAQKSDYDQIVQNFRDKREKLDRKRELMIHDAEVRSRALLNDRQAKTWDEVNQRWRQRHQHGGRHGSQGTTRPSSQPATQQD
jgi:hypothetical protein